VIVGKLIAAMAAAILLQPVPESTSCAKCHIMRPHVDSWRMSSHAKVASCTDCHAPNDNLLRKYVFIGSDGLRHTAISALQAEPQFVRIKDEGAKVLQENCLRCHGYTADATTQDVSSSAIPANQKKPMSAKAYHADMTRSCVECHSETTHGKQPTGYGNSSAFRIRTAYSGTSFIPRRQTVRTFSIFRTASMPSTTRPKAQ
jgi:cytochrome c nitrite reductase small subunit